MSGQPQQRRTSLLGYAIAVVLLIVLYVASLGPVVALWDSGYISDAVFDRLFDTVCFPLSALDEITDFSNENPIGMVYSRYVEWWVDL